MKSASQETAIADAVHRTIVGETELLVSLSVAVIGGVIALIYRRSPRRIEWYVWCVFFASLLFASVSVVVGFIVFGMTIEMAPAFFDAKFKPDKPFSQNDFGNAPLGRLQCFSLIQQISFGLSVILAALMVILDTLKRNGESL